MLEQWVDQSCFFCFAIVIPGNIRVFCRCRPLNKEEILSGYATVVDFNAAKDGDLGILTSGSTKKLYKFDRVYTPKDGQGITAINKFTDFLHVRASLVNTLKFNIKNCTLLSAHEILQNFVVLLFSCVLLP